MLTAMFCQQINPAADARSQNKRMCVYQSITRLSAATLTAGLRKNWASVHICSWLIIMV